MNSPGGRREAQAAIVWNRGSCAPAERSVKGFSRLRRRAKRALDRPFGRRVPVTVPNNGGPWPWRSFPQSLCGSNCESDALVAFGLVIALAGFVASQVWRDAHGTGQGDAQERGAEEG